MLQWKRVPRREFGSYILGYRVDLVGRSRREPVWPIGGMVNYSELSAQNLEELREQITEYYETYYAEQRSQLTSQDPATFQSVPDVFKGYRRIVTELGRDGVVVTHWPSSQDSFDFHISPDRMAKDLAAEHCGGEQIIDYPPGSDFGTYEIAEPLQLVVDDGVVWVAQWTRLEISSRLDAWLNIDQARTAARNDLLPYRETRTS